MRLIELIDRNALLAAYDAEHDGPPGRARELIENAPTVEPKRGRWVDMGDFEQCSVCTGTHLKEFKSYYGRAIWVKTPYCPNCGAKMEGDDKSADD